MFPRFTGNVIMRLYIRKDQVDKDGLAEIYFEVNRKKIGSGENCKLKAWRQKSQMVDNKYDGAVHINNRLKKAGIALQSIIDSLDEFDVEKVRGIFKTYLAAPDRFNVDEAEPNADPVENFSLIVESIIADHRNEWSAGHKKKFRTIAKKFTDHRPNFSVSNISLSWWQDYVDNCFDVLENKHNTIQTDFKALSQLCDNLKDKGYKFNHNIYKASITYVEPKIEPLSFDEVKRIAVLNISENKLTTGSVSRTFEDSRYLWVLAAYLGQRWKDMTRINQFSFYQKDVEVEDGQHQKVWYYTNRAQKTKKLVEIPLLDEAVEWLQKRNFKLPKMHQQDVNRDIKKIAEAAGFTEDIAVQEVKRDDILETVVPRWKRIHIHTGRHSYAVELVKRSIGRPYAEKFVSEMLGHASPATTWKYFNFVMSQKDRMFMDLMKKQPASNAQAKP